MVSLISLGQNAAFDCLQVKWLRSSPTVTFWLVQMTVIVARKTVSVVVNLP